MIKPYLLHLCHLAWQWATSLILVDGHPAVWQNGPVLGMAFGLFTTGVGLGLIIGAGR